MDLEHRSSKPEVAGSSPAEAFSFSGFWIIEILNIQNISGSSNGRTHRFERWNIGSNPLPEANFSYYLGVPQRLYGLVLETSVRKFKSCRPDQLFVADFQADVAKRQRQQF